jgi:hypothetical protein
MKIRSIVGLTVALPAFARSARAVPLTPRQNQMKMFPRLPALLAALGLLLEVVPNASAIYQIAQVNITSPTNGQVVTNQVLNVTGSVTRFSTSAAVSNVLVQLNGGGWQSAATGNYWTNWGPGTVALTHGSNTVSACLVDTNGNVSATNSVTFDYQVTAGAQRAVPALMVCERHNPGRTPILLSRPNSACNAQGKVV